MALGALALRNASVCHAIHQDPLLRSELLLRPVAILDHFGSTQRLCLREEVHAEAGGESALSARQHGARSEAT